MLYLSMCVRARMFGKIIKERRLVRRRGERGDQRGRGDEVVDFHQEDPGCCNP